MSNPNLETVTTQSPAVSSDEYISFEEYLERASENYVSEWVDGTIIERSPANFEHQNIVSFLVTILRIYIEKNDLGIIVASPFAMRLEEQKRGREPDLLFVTKERAHLIEKTYLNGPADLAVEIISPESIVRDRAEKFVEYESAGIKEFWLIDPERHIAEFFGLSADGQYSLLPIENEIFRSRTIAGFFLRVDWLWQRNPSSIAALR